MSQADRYGSALSLTSPVMHVYRMHSSIGAKPAQLPCYRHTLSVRSNSRKQLCVAAAGSAAGVNAASAKRKIEQLAGPKHGLDKTPEEKQAIADIATQLGELGRVDQLDMTGSTWGLVFTESTASSAGKVGPFIGRTEQEFPRNQPGQYINKLYLGPVTASLVADYKQSTKERIDVSFVNLSVSAGPFNWTKEFTNKGTWDAVYIDEDIRVFRTNKKNLFVLKRIA